MHSIPTNHLATEQANKFPIMHQKQCTGVHHLVVGVVNNEIRVRWHDFATTATVIRHFLGSEMLSALEWIHGDQYIADRGIEFISLVALAE